MKMKMKSKPIMMAKKINLNQPKSLKTKKINHIFLRIKTVIILEKVINSLLIDIETAKFSNIDEKEKIIESEKESEESKDEEYMTSDSPGLTRNDFIKNEKYSSLALYNILLSFTIQCEECIILIFTKIQYIVI
jgi:hypothetical protein